MNGIEAMGVLTQGRVLNVVSQSDGPGFVRIAVEDSGPGFPPEITDRMFDASFTTKASGMGMGLSVCQSVISIHGGRLWASPRSPKGAVFQFTVSTISDLDF